MNIFLWIIQGVISIFCIMGSLWRFANYEQASKDVASMNALPYAVWNMIGAFEITCALCLLIPGAFNIKVSLTPIAATCLAIEMLFLSGLHISFFGIGLRASNPASWSLMLAALSAFLAYGRFVLKPL